MVPTRPSRPCLPAARHTPRLLPGLAVLAALLVLAAGTGFSKASRSHAPLDGAPDQAAADVLYVAHNQLGDPYGWGANGPDRWDCSGLTRLWRSVGGARSMPRVAADQQRWAIPIPRSQLLPGDLVFFGDPVTHVGLYTGGGRIIDASDSRGQVVERPVWTTSATSYGRAPRAGMPRVRPWHKPQAPQPQAPQPQARPASTGGLTPLPGLPGVQAHRSSRVALQAVAGARTVRGAHGWDDLRLVRVAWRHAGGVVLPTSRAALVSRGRTVRLADARIGDLVVYGGRSPSHLGFYFGHGYMIDASKTLGAVVVRRVYASAGVRLVRLD